ncbi:histidine phosphatase family protein [Conexibacter woesei]|uniref:Phosphoglycerate mutase n=1 Tax=Conexibacter woesei (strain DSM 14684 / CCUG 47730 / CIP 108061 / JCM 11494 / NBRC 100937 / ID131577) TaxID=469383 RepID=D3FDT1_CONWI|nr:histidine phosphatase family protein [Conexibacter woesei]ADB49655.1 Phosphoglycerate mutase [Conexibacter woesei DSM 14684]
MIYLARHGRTPYNDEGRFQGQGDVSLDETGLRQAAELAERAAGHDFAVLWASPLRRARQTAEAVAARTGLTIQWDERLMETHTGDWTDRSFEEMRAEDPVGFQAWLTGDPAWKFPGGESFQEQGDRVMAALEEIEQGPQPALVVCHGMAIRLALARRRGEPGPGPNAVANGALVPLEGGVDDAEEPPSATQTAAS